MRETLFLDSQNLVDYAPRNKWSLEFDGSSFLDCIQNANFAAWKRDYSNADRSNEISSDIKSKQSDDSIRHPKVNK